MWIISYHLGSKRFNQLKILEKSITIFLHSFRYGNPNGNCHVELIRGNLVFKFQVSHFINHLVSRLRYPKFRWDHSMLYQWLWVKQQIFLLFYYTDLYKNISKTNILLTSSNNQISEFRIPNIMFTWLIKQ